MSNSDFRYRTEKAADGNFAKGDIIRLGEWPFADAVIIGFTENGLWAKLSRPYMYVGNVTFSALMGYETLEHVSLELLATYKKVGVTRTI